MQALNYLKSFVLDDFAQLQANVSVWSTFKVGEANTLCLVGQVH